MFDFEPSNICEFGIGDEFTVVTDICRGDVIAVEQEGPKKFVVRALTEAETNEYDGFKFSPDNTREPGTVKLKLIYDAETSI
jgi:hypothetical protein